MKTDNQTKLVLANSYDSSAAAHIAMGMLKAHDIPAILDNEIMAGVFGIPVAPFDRIRLMVREQDFAEAVDLLKEHGDL